MLGKEDSQPEEQPVAEQQEPMAEQQEQPVAKELDLDSAARLSLRGLALVAEAG